MYVCLGGNDINASSFPKKTYEDIVDFMSLLLNNCIKTVYVCAIILMRTFAKSLGLDKKTFDKKRNVFDNQLGRQFVIFPDIRFPLHYDIDGVHVNEKMGEFYDLYVL